MPLKSGRSDKVIQDNIRKLIKEGKTPAQAAAIAYEQAGRTKRWANIFPKGNILNEDVILPLGDKAFYKDLFKSMKDWVTKQDVPVLREHKTDGLVWGQVTDMTSAQDGVWMGFYVNEELEKEFESGKVKWASVGLRTNYKPDYADVDDEPLTGIPLELSITAVPRHKTRQKMIQDEAPLPDGSDLAFSVNNDDNTIYLDLFLSDDGAFRYADDDTINCKENQMDMEQLKELVHELLGPVMERLDELEKLASESRDDARDLKGDGSEEGEEKTEEESPLAEGEEEPVMEEPSNESVDAPVDEENAQMLKEMVALREELAKMKAEKEVASDLADKPHLHSMSEKLVGIYMNNQSLYHDVINVTKSAVVNSDSFFSERITSAKSAPTNEKPVNKFVAARELSAAEGISYSEALNRLNK